MVTKTRKQESGRPTGCPFPIKKWKGKEIDIMRKFVVNEKEYKTKPFDFNLICDLEDMGVSFDDMRRKSMSLIRGYFGICAGLDAESAGKEMQEHIINGGKFESLADVMTKEMNESDFFRALNKKPETKVTEDPEEETATAEPKKEDWEE